MKIPVIYIRVSTKEQALNGGGLEQQQAAAHTYMNSLPGQFDLSRVQVLIDDGVSSYKGGNLTEGMPLFDFVEGCKARKDGSNYAIIVFSVDRISRMNVWASSQFVGQAIMSGIEIHDLMTRQVLKADDQIGVLLSSINLMRANSESQAKSIRQLSNIESSIKKSIETGKAWRWKLPRWLTIENDQYVLVDFYASMVRDAIDWYIEGWTSGQIVAELNRTGRTYGDKLWTCAYLIKLIKGKNIIGTMTRIKEGDKANPIYYENFYPALVTTEKYNALLSTIASVKAGYTHKPKSTKGRITNIVSGLIHCAGCGGVIHINRSRIDQKYFYCSRNYGAKTCNETKGNYISFERALLTHLQQFDLSQVLGVSANDERIQVETELNEARGILKDVENSITKRKAMGKLVQMEALDALNETRDKVHELESRLIFEFQTVEVPKIDYDIEKIILDTDNTRAKVYKEIQSVVKDIKVRRNGSTAYMLIIYKNDAKHLVQYLNKTGEVLTSVYIDDDNIDVFGGSDAFADIALIVGSTDKGYDKLVRK
ncbi:hypothetical protein GKQ23_13130 [Erwinia sp. E602]|uniref:recombinase family protein n=1 Tax=Erwinia sp. E602 TaxID=2675378 RepID=UPI001BAACAB7|nr:recombinase family protein [Erwinia sp. E602]QUG75877.1 hypothetical protein GKQ23_13130 [Erwinia sp. E602]